MHRADRWVRVVAKILRLPQTPWYVRVLAAVVLAYAASPIDLIPDFVPLLGYLDDAILLPLGVLLVVRLTPIAVRREAARQAVRCRCTDRSAGRWIAASAVLVIWATLVFFLLRRIVNSAL